MNWTCDKLLNWEAYHLCITDMTSESFFLYIDIQAPMFPERFLYFISANCWFQKRSNVMLTSTYKKKNWIRIWVPYFLRRITMMPSVRQNLNHCKIMGERPEERWRHYTWCTRHTRDLTDVEFLWRTREGTHSKRLLLLSDTMLRVWAFVSLLGLAYSATQGVTVKTQWSGGFSGTFTIVSTATVHGWKAHLVCDSPINSLEVK